MPLNHVALTVSDRARSAAFYGEHFGLTERVHEDDHLLILDSDDGSELALSQGKPIAGELPCTNPSASGWRTRLPFARRPTAAGQRALSRRSGRTTGVSCAVQVADPDGYGVEVYSHYSRHDVEKPRPAPLTR
jgi:catechol 2,3-dioxygenase-like lactoylglutathione lyase family enzyme